MHDLMACQQSLEEQYLASAELRLINDVEKASAHGRMEDILPIRRAIQDHLSVAAEVVREKMAEFIDKPSRTRAKKPEGPFGVDVDVIALIGLTQSMNSAMREDTISKAAQACGALIEQEAKGASQKAYDPKLHRQMLDRNRTMPWAMKRKAIQAINSGNGWTWTRWDLKRKTTIGGYAMAGALATGLFEIEHRTTNEKLAPTVLTLSEEGLRVISTSNLMSHLKLTRLPMVTEPSQWAVSDFDAAPYITTAANDGVAFNRKGSKAQRRVYPTWGGVVKVGNHLSQVQFKVDKSVVEAADLANDNGLSMPKFPAKIPERYLFPEDYEERPDEERRAIRKEAGARRKAIYQATVDQAKLENEQAWLKRLMDYPSIYLPHSADWRGRLYPIGDLQFQREDRVRAAFRFARGAPLGDDGLDWLAFHFANSASGDTHGKLDKKPIAERIAWGHQHLDLCRTLRKDWYNRLELWAQGIDKPFAFLQAAYEFADAHAAGRSFVSTVPVGFDGTNSGLQHFSAIMRADDEGRLVNLTASDAPQDVYAEVAEVVSGIVGMWQTDADMVAHDGVSPRSRMSKVRAACSKWINHGIDRSTVKRQVMTFV
ncbi:MAG: DNA-directed RNA polymerase [Geminicoccaceae bacterium]